MERLLDLARICLELDVPHFVNNAYGVQCTACMKAIAAASKHGRLDLFIQAYMHTLHPYILFIQARMPTPTLAMPYSPLRGLLDDVPRPLHPPSRCYEYTRARPTNLMNSALSPSRRTRTFSYLWAVLSWPRVPRSTAEHCSRR